MFRIILPSVIVFLLALPLLLSSIQKGKAGKATPQIGKGILGMIFLGLFRGLLKIRSRNTCPRCQKPVNLKVAACPHCGNVLTRVHYQVKQAA